MTDENRLLESITPTSSEIENDSEITFTTFRNGNTPPQQQVSHRSSSLSLSQAQSSLFPFQPLRHELHVYYHRNTPEPPSSSRLAGEDGMGTDSVEMEFPSGYTDSRPEDENEVSALLKVVMSSTLCLSFHHSATSSGHQRGLLRETTLWPREERVGQGPSPLPLVVDCTPPSMSTSSTDTPLSPHHCSLVNLHARFSSET